MILEKETYETFGYHSSDLSPQSHKNILAICDNCGKIHIIGKKQYRALCFSCAMEKRSGENSPVWKGGKIKQNCKECGKVFKIFPSQIRHGGNFCSRLCFAAWLSKNKKGKNGSGWHGGKVKRICEGCGIEFEIFPSQIKKAEGKYCSRSCAWKVIRRNMKYPTCYTKPELIFEQICKKNDLPFKYTGDGSFWIGKNPSINPDFIECNSKKIAVEIFSYWHDQLKRHCKVPYSQTYEGKKSILKKYGWQLVVFWQEDLERKDTKQFVLLTLKKFL